MKRQSLIPTCEWVGCELGRKELIGADGEPKTLGMYCKEHTEDRLRELGAVVVATCPNCTCKIAVQP